MPTICVGPVRSHCSPIRISPFCCAVALPANPSAATAVINIETFFIAYLPDALLVSIREWPYAEVIAEDVDANNFGGDVLVADADKGAADAAADQVRGADDRDHHEEHQK